MAEKYEITPADAIDFAYYMQDKAEKVFKETGGLIHHFPKGMIGQKFFEWLELPEEEKYCYLPGMPMPIFNKQ